MCAKKITVIKLLDQKRTYEMTYKQQPEVSLGRSLDLFSFETLSISFDNNQRHFRWAPLSQPPRRIFRIGSVPLSFPHCQRQRLCRFPIDLFRY